MSAPVSTPASSEHWAGMRERGSELGMRVLLLCHRLAGDTLTRWVLRMVVAYYYLFAPQARALSRAYLSRVATHQGTRAPTGRDVYRHLLAFAESMLDKFCVWTGRLDPNSVVLDDAETLDALVASGRGCLMIGSHLGNLEVMRALAIRERRVVINAVVFTEHALKFNKVLASLGDDVQVNLLHVTDFGPDTAIVLRQKIDCGEWLVIVGDRTPPSDQGRVQVVPFLGAPANFPIGPMVLAHLLECPVALFFCVKRGRRFHVSVEPFAERLVLSRGQRTQALQAALTRYAERLQAHVVRDPYQWFNFFDFWRHGDSAQATRPASQRTKV